MTKLVCTSCEREHKAPFRPEPDDYACDCGGRRVLPSQAKPRTPLNAVSKKREQAAKVAGKPLGGSTLKQRQPDRDWSLARLKVEQEGCCRVCGVDVFDLLEAAHIIGRACDRLTLDGEPRSTRRWLVEPDRIVTLCRSRDVVKGCHPAYDDGELSILSVLHRHEQIQAVRDAGGIELARKRVSAPDYTDGVARVA